jgi:CDGSH-type Zn-finger protein
MSDTKLTLSLNGPIKVEGNLSLQDHEDNPIPTREDRPFFLCRCGGSGNKPFCDGSHTRVGFKGS